MWNLDSVGTVWGAIGGITRGHTAAWRPAGPETKRWASADSVSRGPGTGGTSPAGPAAGQSLRWRRARRQREAPAARTWAPPRGVEGGRAEEEEWAVITIGSEWWEEGGNGVGVASPPGWGRRYPACSQTLLRTRWSPPGSSAARPHPHTHTVSWQQWHTNSWQSLTCDPHPRLWPCPAGRAPRSWARCSELRPSRTPAAPALRCGPPPEEREPGQTPWWWWWWTQKHSLLVLLTSLRLEVKTSILN